MLRNIRAAAFAALALLWSATAALAATNCSGTTTSSSTVVAQSAIEPITGIIIMNRSANMICVSFDVAASMGATNCGAGSFALQPGSSTAAGGSFASPMNFKPVAVFIISTAGGDAFSCTRW